MADHGPIDLQSLAGTLGQPTRIPGGFKCRCPSHDDKKASLSMRVSDEGKLLVHCHAGCSQDVVFRAVMAALGNGHDHSTAVFVVPRKGKPKAFEIVSPVLDAAPTPGDHCAGLGKAVKVWSYRIADRRVAFRIGRFQTPGGKEIRPQVLVRRSGKLAWEWRAHPSPRPIYDLPGLLAEPDKPVMIVEGEVCVDAATKLLGHRFIATTWAGGSGAVRLTDWSPLAGRDVTIWPDADKPGVRAAEQILEQLDPGERAGFKVLPWPPGVAKGFDVADAVKAWTFDRLEMHLAGKVPEAQEPQEPSSVVALGVAGSHYVYWSAREQSIIAKTASQLAAHPHLYTLLPKDELTKCFPSTDDERREYSATNAQEWLIAKAQLRGPCDAAVIRGRGCWRQDDGTLALHTGNRLAVDGQTKLLGVHGRHIYVRRIALPEASDPITDQQAKAIVDLCDSLRWAESTDGKLLAGWIALAPLCGWLAWRPSIWISGASGTGKSFVIQRIVQRLLGPFALNVIGGTTEAGIRQALGPDALPVIFDEAEGDTDTAAERMAKIMELARAASMDAGDLTKGTPGHSPVSFHVRTTFCFASVGTAMIRAADASRITPLQLEIDDGGRHFPRVLQAEKAIANITPYAIVARMLANMDALAHNITAFGAEITRVFGTSRDGQQLGSLIAGAYTLQVAKPASEATVRAVIEKYGLTEDSAKRQEISDQARCLQAITTHHRRIDEAPRPVTKTVAELIRVASGDIDPIEGLTREIAQRDLARLGMRVQDGMLAVANVSEPLRRALQGTPFAAGWAQYLRRLPGADTYGNATLTFLGRVSKVVRIPIDNSPDDD